MSKLLIVSGLCLAYLCLVQADTSRVARDSQVRRLKVTSIEEEPYMMQKDGKFVGFIPDLLDAISANDPTLNFDISLVMDAQYGNFNNGQWTGMMGELTRKRADFAAAAMTVSETRERDVDFTEPIMDSHLTILIKKPEDGSDSPIKSARDLLDTSDMHYGCVENGYTYNFFKTSPAGTTYQEMWDHMRTNPNDFVSVQKDGVLRVRNSRGKYAMIMESATAEFYMKNEPCELDTVGQLKEVKYAWAVPEGSSNKDVLNAALAELRSDNTIQRLRTKWWQGKCNGDANSAQNIVTSSILVLASQMLLLSNRM